MQIRTCVVVLAIAVSVFHSGPPVIAQETNESNSEAQLHSLLTKRQDVLKQQVDLLEQKLSQNLATVDSVVVARDQLFNAELKLVNTKQQRLEIYKSRLNNLRKLEELVKAQHQAGKIPKESVLSITASRLQAEIDHAKNFGSKDPLDKLQGIWVLESFEIAGMKRSGNQLPARFREMINSIKGNRMTVLRADGKVFECTLKLNDSTNPKQLDMVQADKNRLAKCIYKIVDGKLVIVEGKTNRPTSFETGPTNRSKISTFVKVKKKDIKKNAKQ